MQNEVIKDSIFDLARMVKKRNTANCQQADAGHLLHGAQTSKVYIAHAQLQKCQSQHQRFLVGVHPMPRCQSLLMLDLNHTHSTSTPQNALLIPIAVEHEP